MEITAKLFYNLTDWIFGCLTPTNFPYLSNSANAYYHRLGEEGRRPSFLVCRKTP